VTTYRVGQVLYVVLSKEAKIYPMQVVEEINKKTLDGSVTTYMVRGGPTTDETLSIEQIEGEIFDSAPKIQKALLERATAGIGARVEAAVAKAHEWYPTGFEQASDDELASIKKQGIPSQLPTLKQPKNKKPRPGPSPEVAELALELQQDNEKLELEMPDGTKVRVNSIKVPESMQG
jgi:hypothetical protein